MIAASPELLAQWRTPSVSTAASVTVDAGNVSVVWNGPVCLYCCSGYIGDHTCSIEDLQARIEWFEARINTIRAMRRAREVVRTAAAGAHDAD